MVGRDVNKWVQAKIFAFDVSNFEIWVAVILGEGTEVSSYSSNESLDEGQNFGDWETRESNILTLDL